MSKKTKQKIALAVDNVMSDVENVVLTLVEQFIKLFSFVDDVTLEMLAVIKDTDARRVQIAQYLIDTAHANDLLKSINSTSTFREKLFAMIQKESDVKSKKLFDDNKRLENVISKKDCLKFLKTDVNAKKVMMSMYSNMKYVQNFYEDVK